ncbi:MAG: hypothetical protein ABSD27_07870 [Bryobacteraceae bacterium]|jgi:hypothetical protein
MLADRLRTALLVSWLSVSALLLPVTLAPALVSSRLIEELMPQCDARLTSGRECAACALLGGALLVAEGRLDAAVRRSAAAIPLCAALIWNQLAAMAYAASELKWLWSQARARQRARTEEYSCRP